MPGLGLSEFKETTKPLLRPTQITEMKGEERRISEMLQSPPHISSAIQDRGELMRQHRRLKKQLEDQTPLPYKTEELDTAKSRHDALLSEVTTGMPTQAEMRRNPPGAVDKHRKWERRNKLNIAELKNIRLRLHASTGIDRLEDERDVANLELFRPVGGTSELPMDGAQIAGKDIHVPRAATKAENLKNVMTDAERVDEAAALLALAEKLAAQGNDIGKRTLAALKSKPEKKAPKKREWTPEQREAQRQRFIAMNAAKRAAPAAE